MRQLVVTELQLNSACSSSSMVAVNELISESSCHETSASLAIQSRVAVTSVGGQAPEMKQEHYCIQHRFKFCVHEAQRSKLFLQPSFIHTL